MKYIETRIRATGKYSNYQVKQIMYLIKSISSEISKIIIMGILFKNALTTYIVALIILSFLRCFSGGLHFNTYIKCLLVTVSYFVLAIYILPHIPIPYEVKFVLLNACMILLSKFTPVTSKYRPQLSQPKILVCQSITTTFTFVYIILLYIMPDNPIITVGFWIIILHITQLFTAKLLVVITKRKGGQTPC